MAIVSQKWNGSEVSLGEAGEATIRSEYIVSGTTDEFVAQTLLNAATAATVGALVKKSANITARLTEDKWEGEVTWGSRQSQKQIAEQNGGTGGISQSATTQFEIGGGTRHITQGVTHVASYPAGAPDHKGAIGVQGPGSEPQGVDIIFPVYKWSETHTFTADDITEAWKHNVKLLAGCINDASFRGHAAGEVLFEGLSGQQRTVDEWEITFRFAHSRNETGLTIGTISVTTKKGWDYLWVEYEQTDDGTNILSTPKAVHIDQVYFDADFSLIGIGTT